MAKLPHSPRIRATVLAATFAQEMGLPIGNLWEPGIVRNIMLELVRNGDTPEAWAAIESAYRIALGLGA